MNRPQRPEWLPFQNWRDLRDFALTSVHMAVCVWLYVVNGSALFLVAAVISGLAIAFTVALILFRWRVDSIWDEIDDDWDEIEATVADLDERRRKREA